MTSRVPCPKIEFESILDALVQRLSTRLQQLSSPNAATITARLLSVEQAAQYLSRTKVSVQHLVASGALPSVRADRRVFLDIHDLDAWIEEHKQRV